MATIRKRTWQTKGGESAPPGSADYSDQDGKRRLKTFATKKDRRRLADAERGHRWRRYAYADRIERIVGEAIDAGCSVPRPRARARHPEQYPSTGTSFE